MSGVSMFADLDSKQAVMGHLWTMFTPCCWPGYSRRCPVLPEAISAMQMVIVISLVGTSFAQVRGCRAPPCLANCRGACTAADPDCLRQRSGYACRQVLPDPVLQRNCCLT